MKTLKCEKCGHKVVTSWAKYLSPCPKCKGRMVEQKYGGIVVKLVYNAGLSRQRTLGSNPADPAMENLSK